MIRNTEKLYHKYYEISQTPVRDLSITPRQAAIDQAEKNYGYFAMISNAVKDPLEALEIYRGKDVIECFEQPGRKLHIGEMTKKQMDLYAKLGVETPS